MAKWLQVMKLKRPCSRGNKKHTLRGLHAEGEIKMYFGAFFTTMWVNMCVLQLLVLTSG